MIKGAKSGCSVNELIIQSISSSDVRDTVLGVEGSLSSLDGSPEHKAVDFVHLAASEVIWLSWGWWDDLSEDGPDLSSLLVFGESVSDENLRLNIPLELISSSA